MAIPGNANLLLLQSAAAAPTGYTIDRSVRFNSADTSSLTRSFSASNRKTWTWSAWVKRANLGTIQPFFSGGPNGTVDNDYFDARFDSSDTLQLYGYSTLYRQTNNVFRDASAWYHIVIAVDTTDGTANNRLRIYVNGVEASYAVQNNPNQNTDLGVNRASTHGLGYEVGFTRYFNGYLADVHFIDGQALDPTSFGEFDATTGVWNPIEYTFGTNPNNGTTWSSSVSGTALSGYAATRAFDGNLSTQAIPDRQGAGTPTTLTFTPPSAIQGKVAVYFSSNTGEDNSATFLINGTDVSATLRATQALGGGAPYYHEFDNFTELSSIAWQAESGFDGWYIYAIKVGGYVLLDGADDNSFHLDFADNSSAAALGYDAAGSNDWTVNNLSVTAGAGNDSLRDSPTNGDTANDTGLGGEVSGNYCTWNPLNSGGSGTPTITNGNLDFSLAASVGAIGTYAMGSVAVTSGKFYWEVTATSLTSNAIMIGLMRGADHNTWGDNTGVIYYGFNGNKTVDGSSAAYGATYTNNDVIGVALNLDAGTVTFYKNNSSQGSISLPSSTSGWKPYVANGTSGGAQVGSANFGQRSWSYAAPSGFKALCTANLPTPTIEDPSTVFETVLWQGDGTNNRKITTPFSPDFVWAKFRNQSYSHGLYDTVRGDDKRLVSNSDAAEGTVALGMESDGFVVEGSSSYNDNNDLFVAWTWDAGSSTVSNTDGSITSSVRANASAGFSIVSYTGNNTAGASIGHGLNVVPEFIVCKDRDSSSGWWAVYHATQGNTKGAYLNATQAFSTQTFWNNTTPTSSVFSVGANANTNANGDRFVAYCFAPVAGYSAFGSYTGNGSSTDGPFVFTGFRPRWVMAKASSQAGDWAIIDTARNSYNVSDAVLYPNASYAEDTANVKIDALSNGFKLKSTTGNGSSVTYIYAAFAESPFQYARAR